MRLCTKCLRRVKAQMVLEAKKKDIPDAKIAQAVSA